LLANLKEIHREIFTAEDTEMTSQVGRLAGR
jgi:hypothetical protein